MYIFARSEHLPADEVILPSIYNSCCLKALKPTINHTRCRKISRLAVPYLYKNLALLTIIGTLIR